MGSPSLSSCPSSAPVGAPPLRAFAPVNLTLRPRQLQPQHDNKVIIILKLSCTGTRQVAQGNMHADKGTLLHLGSRTNRSYRTGVRQNVKKRRTPEGT